MAAMPRVRCAQGNLSIDQVNAASRAGTIIVPDSGGRTITVVDGWMRSIGADPGGCTAIILTDNAASPTTVMSTTRATFNSNAIVRAGASGCTSTNVGTALTGGEGLRIGCTVGNLTTSTSLDYCIYYTIT
jgi:hypothetical protein